MVGDHLTDQQIVAHGEQIMLRIWLDSDEDAYVGWWTTGEWLDYDAPWANTTPTETPEDLEKIRDSYRKRPPIAGDPVNCTRAVIATLEGDPLGWVSRYGGKDEPRVIKVGLDICVDAYLNRGLGTEALALWVDHLFATHDLHKIGLDTWSFNPRMMRVAEKVGFRYEGRQRQQRQWQGEWLDLLHYGILHEEWTAGRA
jgi:RimJ/RimL family protein N-acetyltransferase